MLWPLAEKRLRAGSVGMAGSCQYGSKVLHFSSEMQEMAAPVLMRKFVSKSSSWPDMCGLASNLSLLQRLRMEHSCRMAWKKFLPHAVCANSGTVSQNCLSMALPHGALVLSMGVSLEASWWLRPHSSA